MGENDVIIEVIHITKEVYRPHGVPFHFHVKHGEMLSAAKKRLQTRLGMNDREFAKVGFHVIKDNQGRVLEDGSFSAPWSITNAIGDILSDFLSEESKVLALDYVERVSRPAGEKAIKILVSSSIRDISI